MATDADVEEADRRAAVVALVGESAVAMHRPYIAEGDDFFVGNRVRDVARELAQHRMDADRAGFARALTIAAASVCTCKTFCGGDMWPRCIEVSKILRIASAAQVGAVPLGKTLAEDVRCPHWIRVPGPPIPMLHGASPSERCVHCGAWRMTLGSLGMWNTAASLADAIEDNHDD